MPFSATVAWLLQPAGDGEYDTVRNCRTTTLPGLAGSAGRASSTDFSASNVWSLSRTAFSSAGRPAFGSAASTWPSDGIPISIIAGRRQRGRRMLVLRYFEDVYGRNGAAGGSVAGGIELQRDSLLRWA